MNVDQLILWLTKLGLRKVLPDGRDLKIPENGTSFYVIGDDCDLVLGPITTIDIYLFPVIQDGPGFDPSRYCSVSMAASDGLVISSSWWDEDYDFPIYRDFEKFGFINSSKDLEEYLTGVVKAYQEHLLEVSQ